MIAVLSVKIFGLDSVLTVMETDGRTGLNVQRKGIVKQPVPEKPPPHNPEEGK